MSSKHLKIHGTTLSSLLHSVVAGQRYCDGLLFGTTQQTETQQLCDHDEAITIKETTLHITDYITNASSCSFYNSSGALQEQQLKELTSSCSAPLLGWFVYRPCTHSSPSMRESAVSLSLKHHMASQQGSDMADTPLVTLIITSSPEHQGATLTVAYRAFLTHYDSHNKMPAFEALELQALNMGRSLGFNAYQQYNPVLTPQLLSSAAGAQQGSGAAGGGGSSAPAAAAQQQIQELAARVSQQQVAGLEELYSSMLARMSELSRQVSDSQGELAKAAAENAKLLAAAAAGSA